MNLPYALPLDYRELAMCYHVAREGGALVIDGNGIFLERYKGGFWPIDREAIRREISAWLSRQSVKAYDGSIRALRITRKVLDETLHALQQTAPCLPPRVNRPP